MEEKEIVAYAITHAPKGVKGGPYEARGAVGVATTHLGLALRWPDAGGGMWAHDALASVRRSVPHARVIRIVRKARREVGAAKESAAFEAETWREASAVEVLRELVAWDDAPSEGQLEPTIHRARRVLAASGPDPMPVVRAAMRETEAWDAYLAAPATRSRAETEVLDNASRKRFAAVDAYRKAGGK